MMASAAQLSRKAATLGASRPNVPGYDFSAVSSQLNDDLSDFQRKMETAKCKTAIDESFNEMSASMQSVREYAINNLDNLSGEQQREVVGFWREATSFFADVINYLKKSIGKAVDFLGECVSNVMDWLSEIFN